MLPPGGHGGQRMRMKGGGGGLLNASTLDIIHESVLEIAHD